MSRFRIQYHPGWNVWRVQERWLGIWWTAKESHCAGCDVYTDPIAFQSRAEAEDYIKSEIADRNMDGHCWETVCD